MKIPFTKIQAYGNDYVFVDTSSAVIADPGDLSKKICDRRFGVGSDGLILICPSRRCERRMRVFNPDGTEGEMCGNALRGTAKLLYMNKLTDKSHFFIETAGGSQELWLTSENGEVVNITADIGKPRFSAREIPVNCDTGEFFNRSVRVLDRTFRLTAVSWGNPHCVVFVEDTENFPLKKYGSAIENMLSLFPRRTNVTFARVISRDRIRIREWERGTGETLGCGTGCCSAAVTAARLGYTGRELTVEQPGGELYAEWRDDGRMRMTGPSYPVFEGIYDYEA